MEMNQSSANQAPDPKANADTKPDSPSLAVADEGLFAAASPLGSDDDESDAETAGEASPGERPPSTSFPSPVDPRFIQPTPSPWKRAGLLLAIAFLFWLTFQLKGRPGAAKAKFHDEQEQRHGYRSIQMINPNSEIEHRQIRTARTWNTRHPALDFI
ncbi:hypothetical protein DFH09DRAFT_1324270 [Mycena vulgaris]|nr:hypothetical protein DFH09DRAFT_1324270 [Mycena vulgaris]